MHVKLGGLTLVFGEFKSVGMELEKPVSPILCVDS